MLGLSTLVFLTFVIVAMMIIIKLGYDKTESQLSGTRFTRKNKVKYRVSQKMTQLVCVRTLSNLHQM